MSGGRFMRRSAEGRLSVRQRIWLLLCVVLTVLSALCFFRLHRLRGTLITQNAAALWRGESEERFCQISVFLPRDRLGAESDVLSFRRTLDQAMVDASIQAPEGGSLYADAYSGRLDITVEGPGGKTGVSALGVGGDYFLFHPLPLLSGSYLTSRDYMHDRVVLDEELAWSLFGSADVAGMEVTVGGRSYPVAGVIRREEDFASRQARTDAAGMYMDYAALQRIGEVSIDSYELVMPDPISGYAESFVQENFPLGGAVVQNTGRFSFLRLGKVLLDFGKRSMNENGVLYPYWENAARMVEDYAALSLLLAVLLALAPVISLTVLLLRWAKKGLRHAAGGMKRSIEQRIEDKKKASYVRRGI